MNLCSNLVDKGFGRSDIHQYSIIVIFQDLFDGIEAAYISDGNTTESTSEAYDIKVFPALVGATTNKLPRASI